MASRIMSYLYKTDAERETLRTSTLLSPDFRNSCVSTSQTGVIIKLSISMLHVKSAGYTMQMHVKFVNYKSGIGELHTIDQNE